MSLNLLSICILLGLLLSSGATALAAVDGNVQGLAAENLNPAVNDMISSEIDWFQEFENGGNTAIVLAVLFFAMIGFAVERAVRLRRSAIIPSGFVEDVKMKWHTEQFGEIQQICSKRSSVLAKMVDFVVEHREADPELLIPGASDIAVRELKAHNQRAFSLAVIAGLAPLLGLLGTMIGMIESFALVAEFGNDSGMGPMLAGSISKALITTAVGLIIAIPSLALYHLFKFRCNQLGHDLDEEMEILINAWLLKKPAVKESGAEESKVEVKEESEKAESQSGDAAS